MNNEEYIKKLEAANKELEEKLDETKLKLPRWVDTTPTFSFILGSSALVIIETLTSTSESNIDRYVINYIYKPGYTKHKKEFTSVQEAKKTAEDILYSKCPSAEYINLELNIDNFDNIDNIDLWT